MVCVPDLKEQIDKLLDDRKRLDAKLSALKGKEREAERKRETRRKILAGSYLLDQIEREAYSEAQFLADLDAYLTRDRDRALFGLPPLEENSE